jgi:beta-lactamase regulating signal transducer with metallopeptidase domain
MWQFAAPFLPDFLVELTIKSLLLTTATLTATFLMRRSSAAQRHLVLALSTVALLALPVVSFVMPSWSLGLLPDPYPSGQVMGTSGSPGEVGPGVGDGSGANVPSAGAAAGSPWWFWLVGTWATGATLLLAYFVASRLLAWWVARRAALVEDSHLLETTRTVANRLGIARPIAVATCNFSKVPFVSGLWHPRLILPTEASDWPTDRIRAILHHELAHIKRRDVGVQFLAQLACCLYWLNPLAWVMERRLFVERERACDDVALGEDLEAADYAGHLMEVMEEMGNQRNLLWVTAAMAEGTDFKDRILSVLDPGARRESPRLLYTALVVVFTIVLLVPLAAISPWFDATALGAESTTVQASSTSDAPADGGSASAELTEETGARRVTGVEEDGVGLDALVDALHSSVADLREHAAAALGRLGDDDAVPSLVDALEDDDPSVREHVATALGNLGDQRAVAPLADALLHDKNARVREHAASALGQLGGTEAVEALAEALRTDREPRVRAHAAEALGAIGDARAVGPLSTALRDPSEVVQREAAEALSSIQP